jgi:hypothetical protein
MTVSNKKIKLYLIEEKITIKKEIITRLIKIIDIAFITFLYGIAGMFFAIVLDKYIFKYISFQKKDDIDKNKWILFFEILVCLTINGIVAYLLRNTLQMIPFPFNGIYEFSHLRVNEVKSGSIIVTILMYFSKILREKISILRNKM